MRLENRPTNTRPQQQRPPQQRTRPAPAPRQTAPPRPAPRVAPQPQPQRTTAPPQRFNPPPPPAPAAPRTTFFDKIRTAAQNTKSKLESLPRTEQSRGLFANRNKPRPETVTYVARNDTSRNAADAARLKPNRTVGPTAADLKRTAKPSSTPKPAPSRASVAKSTPKPSKPAPKKPAPKKPEPKPEAPALKIDPTHDFDDLETLAGAAATKITTPAKLAPTPPPVIAAAETKLAASEATVAEPQPPVIIGDSIFRSLIEHATAAALVHGSTALGMAISADSDVAPGAIASKPPEPKAAPKETPRIAPTPEDAEKLLAAVSEATGSDARVDAALRDAVQLAARMADGKDVSADGTGLSIDKVLDLTQAEDDLPFVEHKPPTRDSGAGLGDLVISAVNQTDFDIDSSKMEFSGNVQVKSPRFALRSDRFIVHLKADGSGMSYGEAIGNVYIRMQEKGKPTGHEGFASKAIYRPDGGKLTLSGWPKIREEHKEHVAATAGTQMVLYTDGRVKTLGRNRTVIRN